MIIVIFCTQVTDAAAQGRLRRICERKPSQKLNCPEWLHEQWKIPSNRPEMIKKLEECNWQKDWCLTPSIKLWVSWAWIGLGIDVSLLTHD